MTADPDYDVVVIGSGFGGSVVACRLAQARYRVLVLERGHRWGPHRGRRDEGNEAGTQPDPDVVAFPRGARDPWLWDHKHPEQSHGWLDFRLFPHMGVILGSGVGGGSLIYANVLIDAEERTFNAGWPPEITYGELARYYAKVAEMLDPAPVPENQWSRRTRMMKEAADRRGWGDRFTRVDVAVRFRKDFAYDSSQQPDPTTSRREMNAHGAWQGTCAHLANCDVGCDVGAKNTLDKNYLFVAERLGTVIRPLHLVRSIAPEATGYRVHFDRIVPGGFDPGSVSGRLVVLAAGSLGSTELLLRCKEQFRTLPAISDFLGQRWSSNGDFLTPALYAFRAPMYPGRGITIASAIRFLDGHPDDADKPDEKRRKFLIEEGGFPYHLATGAFGAFLRRRPARRGLGWRLLNALGRTLLAGYNAFRWLLRPFRFLRPLWESLGWVNYVMPWFAQGKDAADGTLRLQDGELQLDWPVADSKAVIEAIYDTHKRLSHATRGLVIPPVTWTWLKTLITPHPLGGCNMGTDARTGVVDHKGAVFGYRGLYVVDGAIVPEALGLNPSKTIAALAERIAEKIVADHPIGRAPEAGS